MESEKPGIVSILAAATIDSEKPRVLISAARAIGAVRADAFLLTRSLSGSFSSASSVPIRAPVTIDEDDDDGSVSDEHNLASSEASSYSHGLDTGTNEDENAFEDEIMGGVRVHRLIGEEPRGEIGDGSDFSGGSVIYTPFAGDMDDETSVNYSSFEGESENSDVVDGISESGVTEAGRGSMKAIVVIPRAILSLDDDEFDEILASDEEEAAFLGITKNPDDEEIEVEDRELQFGDKGVVDELECSDCLIGELVSTEEEVVRLNSSDKLDDGLMSFGKIEEPSLNVTPGGCNDFMVENEGNFVEASMGLGQSFKQLIEKGNVQRTINKEDNGGSIYDFDALIMPGDVGVEDNAVESGEIGMTDKPECSGSVTDDSFSTEEDMVQEKFSDDGLVSFETSIGVALVGCNEFLVESEENDVDADRRLDETFGQLVEPGGSTNRIDDDTSCEPDELMIPDEGSIGSGSRDSGDEDTGNTIGKANEHCENDCIAVRELEKLECEGEPEIGISSVSFQLPPTLDSVMAKNLKITGGIDVVVSGCGSSDQKAEQESEDRASNLTSTFETANEIVENGEQISEQINRQVGFQSDGEPNQTSVGIEETSLLLVKDVEKTIPENSSVISDDIMENETHMVQMIRNHTFMEIDECEETCDAREKLSESTFQNYFEGLSSDHSVQLISEKVKERVEKSQLLKAKLQRIIGLCSDNDKSDVTEVVSKLRLSGGAHQTSLGLDYVSDRTKITLPEQEGPDDLHFSINVLVIGKTGVGKSATVNSIFGETKSPVGAFGVTTKSLNYVIGNVGGILVRILDTPGLTSSATEERFNQEVLMTIKKSMKTFPVDVILYIDRLDEHPDIHLLRIITSSLGSSVWQNAIVVLTHAASDVPDSSSNEDFVAQRSSLMHQSIRQAVPELNFADQSKMPGIIVVENNVSSSWGLKTCESTFSDWRLNLLILCCSVKVRLKASSLQKQNTGVKKASVFGSQLRAFTLFCSLWNVLLIGANSSHTSHSHDDLEEKKKRLRDSCPKILWSEQSQECLEQEREDKDRRHETGKIKRCLEEGTVLGRVRTRRGRLGFKTTNWFGIYLETSDLRTGFSFGSRGCRKEEEEEGRNLVRMRGSMSVLGLMPMLVSVFTSVYGRKDI